MSEHLNSSCQQLFQVHILHHYWLDDGKESFDRLSKDLSEQHLRSYDVRQLLTITPTPATAKLLSGLGCIFKNTALGFVVMAPMGSGLSRRCDIRRLTVSDENEQKEAIQEFQSEFVSRKNERAVLIVTSTSAADQWTIAGFSDEGIFKSELIDPNSDLFVELKKNPVNEFKIVELVRSILNWNLAKNMQFAFVLTVKNPDFFNYTALTIRPQPVIELYQEAEDKTCRYKKNVPVLSNLTGETRLGDANNPLYLSQDGSKKTLYLSQPIPVFSDTADYPVEALVQIGDALVQFTSDQLDTGQGQQQLNAQASAMPVFVHQGDIPADGVLLEGIPDDVFALIRLATVRPDNDEFSFITAAGQAKIPAPIFQIRFKNRSTQWYYYHGKTGKNAPVSFIEPAPLPLTFFGNASFVKPNKKQKPSQGLAIPQTDKSVPPKVLGLRSEIFE